MPDDLEKVKAAPSWADDPNANPRSEIEKLGTGQDINMPLLYEQMDEDRMDTLLKTLDNDKE